MQTQPPVNLTQKLGSVIMQIQSFLVVIKSVVNKSLDKFVQVTLFVMCTKKHQNDNVRK